MDKGGRGAPGPRRAMYFLRRSRFLNCGTVQRISVRHLGKFYGDRMSVTLTTRPALSHAPYTPLGKHDLNHKTGSTQERIAQRKS